MALPIVHYNDPRLRRKGEKISDFGPILARLAAEMVETMHEAGGIGLAAQQVGDGRQICVVDLRGSDASFDWTLDGKANPPRELVMPLVIVNPAVEVAPGTPEEPFEEGCLSFPQIRGEVVRPERISVSYQDENGVPHRLSADGLLARCILHEVDHLNGVLFIDRMEKGLRAELDGAIKELARRTRKEKTP